MKYLTLRQIFIGEHDFPPYSSLFLSSFLTFQQMAQHTGVYCKTGAASPTEVGCDQHQANSHSYPINSSLSRASLTVHCLLLTEDSTDV